MTRQRGLQGWVKRAVDVAVAGAALGLSAPVMVGVAAAIALTDGRPVLFRQLRPGKNGEPFRLLKFRTMRSSATHEGIPAFDGGRLTATGKLLRRTSLDELPQLFNVLRGDMSLVGPRPLLMQYIGRYTPDQFRRHEVLPGITGWAQVNGRNALSWDEKFALDVHYVDHWSLWLDAQILGMTVWRVLAPKGVSREGHATMSEYMGPCKTAGAAAEPS